MELIEGTGLLLRRSQVELVLRHVEQVVLRRVALPVDRLQRHRLFVAQEANSSRLDRAYAWEMGAMSSARMRANRAKGSSPFDIYSTANKNSADRPSERVTRIEYCPLGSPSITSHMLYINPSIASLSSRIVIVQRSLEIDTFAWLSSSPQDAGASGSINCSVHQIGSLTAQSPSGDFM